MSKATQPATRGGQARTQVAWRVHVHTSAVTGVHTHTQANQEVRPAPQTDLPAQLNAQLQDTHDPFTKTVHLIRGSGATLALTGTQTPTVSGWKPRP